MPPEHENPEDLVEAPGEAERAARSLEDAVDSHATLDGYYAMNNARPEQASPGAEEDERQAEDREES